MARPKPRKWIPKNPEKYIGDVNNIVSRSSWETVVMNLFDQQEHVVLWCSEEFNIKYISPLDNREHRYFCDFLAKMKTRDGTLKTYLVEIKPNKERFIPTTKNKKQFCIEMQTYLVNQAKWKAAEAFCQTKNISFLVLDEYDIGLKKRPTK
jgi:hypothetical protein